MYSFLEIFFILETICWSTCLDLEDCMIPSRAVRTASLTSQGAQRGSASDPSALLSPIRAPQSDSSLALWSNPSPTASCSHIAHLPIITAVGCKNYIDLFALQKAKLCQSTTWQVFMFFHWINLTFKHQATIFISMEVNSSYSGPQLFWQLL